MVHSTYSAQQNYFNIRFQKVSAGVIRVLKGMVILNKLLAQAIVFLEEHIKSASVTIISFLHESIPPVLWLTGYKNHGFTNNFVFTEIFTKLRIRACYTVRSQTHHWLTNWLIHKSLCENKTFCKVVLYCWSGAKMDSIHKRKKFLWHRHLFHF